MEELFLAPLSPSRLHSFLHLVKIPTFLTLNFLDPAPFITIMDHRGCEAHKNTEYFGEKSYSQVKYEKFFGLCF